MGQTLVEKVISSHINKNAKTGEIHIVPVDFVFGHDLNSVLTISKFKEMGLKKLANPEKTAFFIDHLSPPPRIEFANDQKLIKEFALEKKANFFPGGSGVCHQVVAERYASPDMVIVGADSHTCMNGAFGSISTGMGSTDVAAAMGLGKTWLKVPETINVVMKGKLGKWVYSKDIIQYVIGELGASGADYQAMEFTGKTADKMDMDARLTMCNMVVEAGGKTGAFYPDKHTKDYLKEFGRSETYKKIDKDDDATYVQELEVDVSNLEPTITKPHNVDKAVPIGKVKGTKLNQVYIGSCTDTRMSDLRAVAKVLKGNKIDENIRLIIAPSSKATQMQAMKEGLIEIFIEAGAIVNSPGCSACGGYHAGIVADNDKVLSSTNRNFKGRMGNPNAEVYLASPVTCAVSAITGEITDPREALK